MFWWYEGSLHCWAALLIDHNSFQWYCNQSYPIDESYLHIYIISSSSSSHRFHPYRYIVNLVMIASNQSANSQILQSWYKVTSSSSPSCIINILKRLIDRCCTVFTNVTCHRAIAASLVQDKLLFSKEGQGFDSWIWFHEFHYTS